MWTTDTKYDAHLTLSKTEFAIETPSTCGVCGAEGSGYIHDGWDMATDNDTGEDFEICPDCNL